MRVIFIFRCAPKGHERLYENTPSLYSSPSTGEGGVGVIVILRCAPIGNGGLYENTSSYRRRPVSSLLCLDSGPSPE